MFDLAWSEILLIAVVALIVIGPKDLPGAIRGIADTIKKARKGLSAMQQQADELVREAKLDEVRNQIAEVRGAISEIRNFDLKGHVEKAVDGDGTLKSAFNDPAFPAGGAASTPAWTPPPTARDTPDAPAMIPPQTMVPYKPPPVEPEPPKPDAPAFLPPSTPAPPPPLPVASTRPVETPSAAVMPPALEPAKQPETRPA
jgi:sec-independent protein translocase protein TatB